MQEPCRTPTRQAASTQARLTPGPPGATTGAAGRGTGTRMPDLLEVDVLAERVVEAREDEARRIARMIHDHVGQLAAAACLAVAELGRDLSEDRRPALDRLARCVTSLEEGLRGMAREIHAVGVSDRGLPHALSCLVDGFRARL